MAPKGKSVQQPHGHVKQKESVTRRKPSKVRRGLKRKARQEEVRVKRRRHNYNLRRSSGSVEFVSEAPYSTNKDLRRKYRRLGLDSALFHCKSRPARRKQSHISVVTVSSSDDEESMNRTAAWVASVQVEDGEHPSPEEASSHSDAKGGGEAEEVIDQFCHLQIPSSAASLRQGCSISAKSTPSVTKHDQNAINLLIYENPTLNTQGSSYTFSSAIEDQVLSNRLQTPFCSVTADLNKMAENKENHSPFLTIKSSISPEFSHGQSSFYTSTPRRKCNSATEKTGTFCVITPEWHHSSQEWKPIFSSRYKNNKTSPRSGIDERTSSTINSNFVQKQNVELVNSQEQNSSVIDFMETQSMSNVTMEIPQTSTPSTVMLFNNSNQRETGDIHQIKPRKLFLFDSPMQSQNNDHTRVDPQCFYFGSQNPPQPTESELLTQENSSISLAEECCMSGIVRMADENDKHSQESVFQDINDSYQNADDDNLSLSNSRTNYSI